MDFLASIASDWRNWALLGLAFAALGWGTWNRMAWDKACAARAATNPNVKIPERRATYDPADLRAFVRAIEGLRVAGCPALDFYVGHILRRSDLGYAVALSLLTAVFWAEVALSPFVGDVLAWMALPFGAMAIVYGVADIAEDVKLARILEHPTIDRADVASTSALTRIKMVSLFLSVAGLVIFLILQGIERIAAAVRRTREQEPSRT
jgi:hypothetical protein